MQKKIPIWVHMIFMILTVLLFVPPFVIARARYAKSPNPRIHPIPDMDNQKGYRKQGPNKAFKDGRGMRLPVAGTVALGELREDDHLHRGVVNGEWATDFPPQITVDMTLMERGRERFDIYCAPCHGHAGDGQGMIHQRAQVVALKDGWVQPKNLHENQGAGNPVDQSVGELYNTITNGKSTMSGYRAQIPVRDRWAIVAYLRALQKSQNAE